MQIPNITLAYSVLESKQFLENGIVRKVQELENNWLKIKLHTLKGQKELIIAPQMLFFSDYSMPAKQVSSGFGGFLRKHLENKKILKIWQHEFDRIVFLEFQDFFLVLELFAKGNIILTDKEKKILGVLHREEWKDRSLKKDFAYKTPSSKGTSPLSASLKEFEKFKNSEFEIVKELVKNLNIAPIVAEEALLEAKIPKETQAKKLSPQQLEKLAEKIKDFYSISLDKLKPVVAERESEKTILPFPFASAKTIANFASLNNAFEEHFCKDFFGKEAKKTDSTLQKKLLDLQKNLATQLEAKTRLEEKAEIARKKGEMIFAHYTELQRAIAVLKEAKEKGSEKDIMYKMKNFSFVKSFDTRKRVFVVELD